MDIIDFIYVVVEREKTYDQTLPDGKDLIDETQSNLHAFIHKDDAVKWAKRIAKTIMKIEQLPIEDCGDLNELEILDHWVKLGSRELTCDDRLRIDCSIMVEELIISTVDLIGGA